MARRPAANGNISVADHSEVLRDPAEAGTKPTTTYVSPLRHIVLIQDSFGPDPHGQAACFERTPSMPVAHALACTRGAVSVRCRLYRKRLLLFFQAGQNQTVTPSCAAKVAAYSAIPVRGDTAGGFGSLAPTAGRAQ